MVGRVTMYGTMPAEAPRQAQPVDSRRTALVVAASVLLLALVATATALRPAAVRFVPVAKAAVLNLQQQPAAPAVAAAAPMDGLTCLASTCYDSLVACVDDQPSDQSAAQTQCAQAVMRGLHQLSEGGVLTEQAWQAASSMFIKDPDQARRFASLHVCYLESCAMYQQPSRYAQHFGEKLMLLTSEMTGEMHAAVADMKQFSGILAGEERQEAEDRVKAARAQALLSTLLRTLGATGGLGSLPGGALPALRGGALGSLASGPPLPPLRVTCDSTLPDLKEGNADCCTSLNPCTLSQGDCDEDADCGGSLVCGAQNCVWNSWTNEQDDCCMNPLVDPLASASPVPRFAPEALAGEAATAQLDPAQLIDMLRGEQGAAEQQAAAPVALVAAAAAAAAVPHGFGDAALERDAPQVQQQQEEQMEEEEKLVAEVEQGSQPQPSAASEPVGAAPTPAQLVALLESGEQAEQAEQLPVPVPAAAKGAEGARDVHGCLVALGFEWCAPKNACVQDLANTCNPAEFKIPSFDYADAR